MKGSIAIGLAGCLFVAASPAEAAVDRKIALVVA